MARLVAAQPLNMAWRHGPFGSCLHEIVADKRNGVPWPADTAFELPDDCAAEFVAAHGPQPDNANIAGKGGRIAGLAILD